MPISMRLNVDWRLKSVTRFERVLVLTAYRLSPYVAEKGRPGFFIGETKTEGPKIEVVWTPPAGFWAEPRPPKGFPPFSALKMARGLGLPYSHWGPILCPPLRTPLVADSLWLAWNKHHFTGTAFYLTEWSVDKWAFNSSGVYERVLRVDKRASPVQLSQPQCCVETPARHRMTSMSLHAEPSTVRGPTPPTQTSTDHLIPRYAGSTRPI